MYFVSYLTNHQNLVIEILRKKVFKLNFQTKAIMLEMFIIKVLKQMDLGWSFKIS